MTSVTLVMPVYNAAHLLGRVLPPLRRALDDGELQEVILVDDSSTDESARKGQEAGFQVLPSQGRLGPGGCRNIGARAARGDVLLFVDSDVVAHDDVFRKVAEVFDRNPDCVALFGSYDDEPAAPGIVSRYRNLLHHWTHQQGQEEAGTFWAGCGAVRRDAYLRVGGFNEQKYGMPSIEDIELGHRLRQEGRILLRKDILGKHLKRWTFLEMVRTDVFKRALPWSRLLLSEDAPGGELNVNPAERRKAMVAGLFWAAWAVAPFYRPALWGALACTVLATLVNRRFFALVWRKNGPLHGVSAVVLQQLYYLYSTLAWVYCLVEIRVLGVGRRQAGG